jgi:hypothetical protein
MPLDRPYCTVQQLRDFISNDNPDLEAKFEEAVNRASRYVDQRLGASSWFQDYSVTAYPVDKRDVLDSFILLPFPIITLTEVVQEGETLAEGEEDDYQFTVGERTIRSNGTWGAIPYTGSIIRIKGTFGYALSEIDANNTPPPSLPFDINDAAIRIAAVLSGMWKKSSRSIDGSSETVLVQSIPREVEASLRKMRLTAHRVM